MPVTEYATTIRRPRAAVWEFVSDMGNWAPFLVGYRAHEVIDERDSIWTLQGDVGVLSRTVRLRAHVTEWRGPERVAFTLTGENEMVEGSGVLVMEDAAEGGLTTASRVGFLGRIGRALARLLLRLLHRGRSGGAVWRLRKAEESSGRPAVRLTFTLRMEAGGPMGPLVNAMLGPAMGPAAEQLAERIAAHLEGNRDGEQGGADVARIGGSRG